MSEVKIISNKNEFQDQVVAAVEMLANPVKATLGPGGLPIVLDRDGQPPLITKDGVTVANHVFAEDPKINVIIQAIKEAAMQTNSIAGDGTTTAILLTESIIKQSQLYLKTQSINPQVLSDSLIAFSSKIIDRLNTMAVKVKSKDEIKNVAFISCNGDEEISQVVCDAIESVGIDGVVTLEEGGIKTNLRLEEGFSINRGFGSLGPYGTCLINIPTAQQVKYESPGIIVYDGMVEDLYDLGRCLENVNCGGQDATPLVLFAHDFSPQIINMVIANVQRSGLRLLPIKVPKLGSMYSQSNVIDDIAILTGAKVIRPGFSKLSDIINNDSEYLGSANKIISSRKETIIYEGSGSEKEIQDRAEVLRTQMKDVESEFDRDILKERLGRLIGGIAIVEVGAVTDLEMKEKKDRIEDALNATRAALEEGVVPGGGSALLSSFYLISKDSSSDVQDIYKNIFGKVCEASVRQISKNRGKLNPDVVVAELYNRFEKFPLSGYNARSGEYTDDMIKSGIIDPVKVVKTGLTNAVSIATMLLRSGGSIVNKSKSSSNSIDNSQIPEESLD